MTRIAELTELEKVLKKNPVINTASSEELTSSPESVERNYMKHAMTHMSLGDTKDYEDRMFRYLLRNKRAFSGLVTGDFGLGKTSFLVYLWKQCEEKGVMAIPPFSWRSLDDLFQGITKWINYKLEQKNMDAVADFHDITDYYTQRSMKKEIDLLVRAGMDKQSAKQHMEQKVREGTFRLDRNVGELLQFLDKVTPFLEKNGYEGLMVFTDELQITLSELAPEKVFQYMFEIANNTMSRDGKYGIMVGLPLNSFVQMQQVKSDALDRFAQQKMLVDLSKIYTADFAVDLWEKYTEYFQFTDIAANIIDEYGLKSLGQLTDCTRKDIGNGPRSVISAFNAIISHYEKTGERYTVLHLVEDIMREEILLGERSKFISKIKGLLQKVENDPDFTPLIYTLAGFPQGCKQEIIAYYGVLNDKTEQLLTEWLGKEIRQSRIEGYRLAVLDEVQAAPEGFFEQAIRNFLRFYQASDMDYQQKAVKSFNSAIVPELLTEKGQLNWTCLFEQQTEETIEFEQVKGNIYSTEIGGTYDKVKNRFPNRHLHIVTQSSLSDRILINKDVTDDEYSYVGQWIFYLDLKGETTNAIIQQDRADLSFAFTLNTKEKITDTLPLLSELVPLEAVDVQLALNLVYYLTETTDVPPSEQQELEYFLKEIIDATITTLFNQNMKKVRNSEIEMRNHGRSILVELFENMCEKRFGYYHTLMVGRMKQRMNHFKTFLENEHISLSVKRGTQPIADNFKRLSATDKRDKVTSKFNILSVAPFEQLMQDFPSLLQIEANGDLYARIHPAEQLCLEVIQASDELVYDNDKPCQAARVHVISDKLKELGYVSGEIDYIFAFGALRKLFQYEQRKQMLYIKPLTIEEWQLSLQEKLSYISELIDELALVNINVKVDTEAIAEGVENLNDEHMYEELSKKVREAESLLLQKMSTFINQQINVLGEKLDKSSRVLTELFRNIEEVELTDDTEKQDWYKAQEDLKAKLTDIQASYTAVFTEKAALSPTTPKDFMMSNNGIENFINLSSKLEELHKKWDKLKDARKKLEAEVKKWIAWTTYFEFRLELRNLIDRLETMGLSHLISDIDVIDEELNKEWDKGIIPSHETWLTKLKNVHATIQDQIRKSRDLFETEKQSYQTFLNESNMGYRLRTQFNEVEQSQSYDQLRDEFKEAVEEQIEAWLTETDRLEQRLLYLTEILEVDVTDVEEEVFSISSDLFRVKAELEKSFTIEGVTPLKGMKATIQNARKKVEGAVQKGKLEAKEERLLSRVRSSSITLEELILEYSKETDSLNLEEVLGLITNLFKKNHINIRIEKGGK